MRRALVAGILACVTMAVLAGCSDALGNDPVTEGDEVESPATTRASQATTSVAPTDSVVAGESPDIRIEIVESAWGTGEGSGDLVFVIRGSDIASWAPDGIRLKATQMESDLYDLVAYEWPDLSVRFYLGNEEPILGRVLLLPHAAAIDQPSLMVGYWHVDPDPDDFALYLEAGGSEIAGHPLDEYARELWSRSNDAGP